MLGVLDRGKNFCLCRSLRREGMAALSGLERQPFWPLHRSAKESNGNKPILFARMSLL